MKTVKEIQAEVKREESVLNQLEKRGAASSVIEAQKEEAELAEAVANGDLTITITPRSDKDQKKQFNQQQQQAL